VSYLLTDPFPEVLEPSCYPGDGGEGGLAEHPDGFGEAGADAPFLQMNP